MIRDHIDYFLDKFLPSLTREEANIIYGILKWDPEKKAAFFLAKQLFEIQDEEMDDKIKKLQKDTKKIEKQEGALLKADKKRDKFVDAGKKALGK